MASRPSRSASIPIPGSTGRNIEDVISMPFMVAPPARPRLVSGTRLHVPSSPERPLSGRVAVSISPVRSLSSGGYAAALNRPSVSHSTSVPVFEPRIIGITPSPSRAGEPGCAPAPVPTQGTPSRTRHPSVNLRRPSTTAAPPVAVARTASTSASAAAATTTPAPAAFPRPAYLEQSALRDLLYTDASAGSSATTLLENVVSGGPAPRTTTPVPAPYPYLRREVTPGWGETDSESNTSTSPPPARTPAPPPGALLTNPALRLPTKWSEQDRHHLLTVSHDGRELTFYGACPLALRHSDTDMVQANPASETVTPLRREPTILSHPHVASTTTKLRFSKREPRGELSFSLLQNPD